MAQVSSKFSYWVRMFLESKYKKRYQVQINTIKTIRKLHTRYDSPEFIVEYEIHAPGNPVHKVETYSMDQLITYMEHAIEHSMK